MDIFNKKTQLLTLLSRQRCVRPSGLAGQHVDVERPHGLVDGIQGSQPYDTQRLLIPGGRQQTLEVWQQRSVIFGPTNVISV